MKNAYVFDMGGVIKHSYDLKGFYELLNCDCSYEDFHHLFADKVYSVETGKVDQDDFFQELGKELKLNYSLDEIMKRYVQCFNKIYPGTVKIIQELINKGEKVYLFSDLKPIDFQTLCTKINIHMFEKVYLSYNIGYLKENIKAFQYVIKDLNIDPSHIYFFDDRTINILNAKECGIHAFQVTGDTIEEVFQKNHIL
jgi:putative hydrolase of the HAD superfamily